MTETAGIGPGRFGIFKMSKVTRYATGNSFGRVDEPSKRVGLSPLTDTRSILLQFGVFDVPGPYALAVASAFKRAFRRLL